MRKQIPLSRGVVSRSECDMGRFDCVILGTSVLDDDSYSDKYSELWPVVVNSNPYYIVEFRIQSMR